MGCEAGHISYDSITLPEDALKYIRHALYHSESPGYFIFRNFISPEFVRHIAQFWCDLDEYDEFKVFQGKEQFRLGCPNFYKKNEGNNEGYYNFFWNTPRDSATYSVAFAATMLRNRIEGFEAYREIFPLPKHPTFSRAATISVSFRVVITRSGNVVVPVHEDVDFYGIKEPWRTQMTLFLSEGGKDYSGEGFWFEDNQGKNLLFGRDVPVEAGDLVIWRYANAHSVQNVKTQEGQQGFVRVIFPPERIYVRNPILRTIERIIENKKIENVLEHVKSNEMARKLLRPIYARFRHLYDRNV